jgi:hypothetical protein
LEDVGAPDTRESTSGTDDPSAGEELYQVLSEEE